MIVVDASAAVAALLNDGPSRQTLAAEQLHASHLVDTQVASALPRLESGRLTSAQAWAALDTWRRLAVTRYLVHGLLDCIWQLRHNLTAYDAGYVALAESLDAGLLTADARLASSTGIRCSVTLVPR